MVDKNYALENPKEIFTNFSGKEESRVTMAVECYMTKAKIEDKITPQALFGQFTRLVFHLLRSGTRVKANVNFDELPDIEERTEFVRSKIYENELSGSAVPCAQEDTSDAQPAYTTLFTMGPYKGRTPADIVLEDPEGNRAKLREQYEFLKNNADKYPRNKKIMEAIINAYNLYDSGALEKKEKSQSQGSRSFEIYKSGYRPQTRDKREDGKCRVQEMNVLCNIGNRYPIELTISEYYAPVTNVNGRLNVQASAVDAASVQKITAYMTLKDWNCLLHKVRDQKTAFIASYGKDLLEEADKILSAKFKQPEAV